MKHWKKTAPVLLTLLLCLGLAACAISADIVEEHPIIGVLVDNPVMENVVDIVGGGEEPGEDWRTRGLIQDGGTITCDGEDTYVLVCVHREDAVFYYDSEDQTMYDYVEYPIPVADRIARSESVWELFQGIDFADVNGDGNSDVSMRFSDSEGEFVCVWFWVYGEGFVFQREASALGEALSEGWGDLLPEEEDDSDKPALLMDGRAPFENMNPSEYEYDYDTGMYYYSDLTPDGIEVIRTVLRHESADNDQSLEDYLTDCALWVKDDYNERAGFEPHEIYMQSVEQNEAYSESMGYPVYIVTFIEGEGENALEWIVYATDTGSYTYLYAFNFWLEDLEQVEAVCWDVFARLHLL